MRRLFNLSLSIVLLQPAAAVDGEPVGEPYQVYIGHEGASVFSGPGDDYYVTQQLSVGAKCEVYEELRDGWLAVRPPEGSYSLVLRSALGPIQGEVAQVKRDGTPSRVGSVVVDKFSSVHVRLDEGEAVQVIEGDSSSQWVTIAPPAGEFRWVRERDVYLKPPASNDEVVVLSSDSTSVAVEPPSHWRERPVDGEPTLEDQLPVRTVMHEDANRGQTGLSAESRATANHTQGDEAPTFESGLSQIEVELSRRVAGPVNLWVFDDLERRAASLVGTSSTPSQEQLVRDVAARMSRFASIATRYRNASGHTDSGLVDLAATETATVSKPLSNEHDAVGVLRPVVSTRGNAPPYALVDETGEIVTFVTPSPSLNLQQYLGQRVGVNGTRGFLPQYRSRNIQTARVAPLDGTLRR